MKLSHKPTDVRLNIAVLFVTKISAIINDETIAMTEEVSNFTTLSALDLPSISQEPQMTEIRFTSNSSNENEALTHLLIRQSKRLETDDSKPEISLQRHKKTAPSPRSPTKESSATTIVSELTV